MACLEQRNEISSVNGAYYLSVYSSAQGGPFKLSLANLSAYILGNFTSPAYITQWSTPGATGFNIQVYDSSANTWLIINPAGAYATGAITLPAVANCADGQEILVVCSQQVVAFTVNGNGAIAVNGVPSALAADDSFRLRFQRTTKIWYRV